MQIVLVIALLLIFGVFVFATIKGLNITLGFIAMAIILGLFAGYGWTNYVEMFDAAIATAQPTMLTILLGAFFGQVMIKLGITSGIIRKAVELGGDNPLVVTLLLSGVCVFIFTSAFGSGMAIAVGQIVLPIMFALGISKAMAATIFLLSINFGNIMNPILLTLNKASIPDYDPALHPRIQIPIFIGLMIILIVMIVINISNMQKKKTMAKAWAAPINSGGAAGRDPNVPDPPAWSFISPALPAALFMIFGINLNLAFILSVVVALLLTGQLWKKGTMQMWQQAARDGFYDLAPLCLMLIGLYMFMEGARANAELFSVVFQFVLLGYIGHMVVRGLLAPLALFRGPWHTAGIGIALVTVMQAAGYPAAYLAPVNSFTNNTINPVDPTNGYTIWTMGFTKVRPAEIMKGGLFWVWLAFIMELILIAIIVVPTLPPLP